MNEKTIFKTLREGGFINPGSAHEIASNCRDAEIKVFLDTRSQLIYLDPNYEGRNDNYYLEKDVKSSAIPRNDMDIMDTQRRSELLKPVVAGKRWLDFGCGPGYQLRQESHFTSASLGVELNKANSNALIKDGFKVTDSLDEAKKFEADVISMFHVLEHLSDPVQILSTLRENRSSKGKLIVEVPHANDWLIKHGPTSFKDFTFWSEHLVLHTRNSLRYLLEKAGWQVEHIFGAQRYPVWNHMHWFSHNKPSGFSASPNSPSAASLHKAYEAYLADMDQTDTIIAIANTGELS